MRKVMVIVPALSTGGGERMALSIIENINAQDMQIRLVSLYPDTDSIFSREAKEKGIDIVYLNKKNGMDFAVVKELRREIRSFHPDVIHTHLYVVPYVMLAAKRKTVKYHTVHNIADKEATGLLRKLQTFAFHHCNFRPVAISPFCAKTITDVYGIPTDEIPCILNGMDTDRFFPAPVTHEGIRLVSVGRFEEQKNQKLLLTAFHKVVETLPEEDILLDIVGEGYLRPELEAQADSLGIRDKVLMEGISRDVPGRLNMADIYVQSSDFEGLPVSVCEALACGLPVVATKAGGTVDIVKDGETGILTEIGDADALAAAIIRLVKDGEEREKMAMSAAEFGKTLSIQTTAAKYEELYRKND